MPKHVTKEDPCFEIPLGLLESIIECIYLYPCVLNTTHTMQETDQCYGLFKSQFFINHEQIIDRRLDKDKSLLVGLPACLCLVVLIWIPLSRWCQRMGGSHVHVIMTFRC